MIKTIMNCVFGAALLGMVCGASVYAGSGAEETAQLSRWLSVNEASKDRIQGFVDWINKYDKIHVVVGDQGSYRFMSDEFREKAGAVIFIDPLIGGELMKTESIASISGYLEKYPSIKKKVNELLKGKEKCWSLVSRLPSLRDLEEIHCTDELNTKLEDLKSELCNFIESLGTDNEELKEKWNSLCDQWNEKRNEKTSERKVVFTRKIRYLRKILREVEFILGLNSISDLEKFLEPVEFETLRKEISIEDYFAFGGTWEGFVYFVKGSKEVENALKEKVEWVFDDWSVLLDFNNDGWGRKDTRELNNDERLKEWLELLSSILIPYGRIFMGTYDFTSEEYSTFCKYFTPKLCMKNVKRYPERVFDLKNDRDFGVVKDDLIFLGDDITKQYKKMGIYGYSEMTEENWKGKPLDAETKTMFFVDGFFRDRFIAFEKKTSSSNVKVRSADMLSSEM